MSPAIAENPDKTAVWAIETTHPDLAEKVEEALKEVMDIEIGLHVIELGLVRDIFIDDEDEANKTAHVEMILTTPYCPYAPAMLEATRSKVEKVVGMPTTIEMGFEYWQPEYMEEGKGADWGFF